MDIRLKSINELIDIALKTTCLKEMLFLQEHPSMNVRRSLAKNINIDESILNVLSFDPVENVSYMAGLNPKSKTNREFTELRPCVRCDKDDSGIYCLDCDEVKEHKF